METTGKIKMIFDTVKVSDKFSRRELVITTEDKYPQDILFQVTNDKCKLLDNLNIGQDIKVHFNLRGREWNGKYYNNLEAWKLEFNNDSNPF